MKKIRRWLGLALILVVGGLIVAAFLEPTQTVRGFLAGDSFFRGRPTRYWREYLRADGRYVVLSPIRARRFKDTHAAFAVLRECTSDPDRNVRWPAITLFGVGEARSEQILSVLVNALDDEVMEVRLQAIRALACWGSMARSAIPSLANRLNDPDLQVAHFADLALWDIDQTAAVKICGWKPFKSVDWNFTVMLPDEPEHTEQPLPFGIPGALHSFMVHHKVGPYPAPTCYAIAVSEYPAEFLEGKSKEEMLAMSRDMCVAGLGGKLIGEQAVEQHGLKGMEHQVEVEGKGNFRGRLFWVDRRLYQVVVTTGMPEFLNIRAADYFMESFQLDKQEGR